ncbi:MAG: MFS transporter [Planctomycetia bacterium]|nr:MFS transporter [Planctomycetia bacterium]
MSIPDETPPSTALPRNVRLLGLTSLVNDIASEMIFPLLPKFLLGVLGGDKLFLGVIEGIAESTASLLKLFAGAWSDRLGRRKGFVVFGYLLAALARPLIGIAAAPWHVLAARFSDRVGKGVRTAPRDALIAESVPPGIRGRAFGFHRAMDHLGAAIGPLLATGFLFLWPGEYRALFLLTLIPGLLVVSIAIFGLREPPRESSPQVNTRPASASEPVHRSASRSHFDPRFRWLLAAIVVFTLGNSSDAFLLVRAEELGVAPVWLPTLWCAFHLMKSGGNLIAGRITDRVGPRPMLLGGWIAYALIYAGFAFATAAWHAWALFGVYALHYAVTEPAEKTLVAEYAGARRGLAFGWFNFALGIVALPANLLCGALYRSHGAAGAFGLGAALAVIASVILTRLYSARQQSIQPGEEDVAVG